MPLGAVLREHHREIAENLVPDRLGVAIGSSGSDLQAAPLGSALTGLCEQEIDDPRLFGPRILAGVHPLWLIVNLPNMASAHVAIEVRLMFTPMACERM